MTRFKEFRTFWPCYFTDTLVKGTDNFWKVRGLIYGFSELRRQISYGVGKTADALMSAMRFCTTPKEYLPHYSYIFMRPEPLGIETKNMDFYMLGTMLQLDIQQGKEDLKTSDSQKDIGGTAA